MGKYVTRDLIKVVDHGKTIYYAVTNDTADNMLNTSSGLQYVTDYGDGKYQDIQFDAKLIGTVLVEMEYSDD